MKTDEQIVEGKVENLYTKDCIRTYTGIYMNIFEPTPEMICIEDIAHALSNQCRFGGHLHKFYSVAQHCVLTSRNIYGGYKLEALLHDASEAYLLDVPRPIKHKLTNYQEIEALLMKLIFEKFGLIYPLHGRVKEADEYMLQWEWNKLMLYDVLLKDTFPKIECWSPEYAEECFLETFELLNKKA